MKEKMTELKPLFSDKIAICFVCDDKYVPYLSVALESLYRNSNKHSNYDIIILETDISKKNKFILESYNKKNFNIRFFDISEYLETIDTSIFYLVHRYTVHTYYRFFVTEIFKYYEKVIYLDSDTLIRNDIANLYCINIDNNYVGATKDLYIPLYRNTNDEYFDNYFYNVLKLSDPNNYFQAGVLIFNIPYCTQNDIKTKLIETLKIIKEPFIVDQDILNKVCEGKVVYIDGRWDYDVNITILCCIFRNLLDITYNEEEQERYQQIKDNAYIVHFAGANKPWDNLNLIYAKEYWKYIFSSKYSLFFIKNYLINNIYKKLKVFYIAIR